ncbi:MAG: UDP-N-acetylmuramoyl-L-alanyl-D-glutamate--2,6-diaminopimelate ligase [Eubacteriaceae bacterium]
MKIKEIIKVLDIQEEINIDGETSVKGIAYNSLEVKPDMLFVAISGFQTDGHKYIDDAIKKGASVIVFEKDLKAYQAGIAYIKVKDSRHALGTIGASFYGNPSREMVVTGVTGTNGKTSITYMLNTIFKKAGKKCGLIGTIHNIIDERIIDNKGRTTPESLELHEMIREMRNEGCDYLSMEVSSHGLSLDRVNGVDFKYGIFTNLTQDHLDYHKTFENYFDAKAKLFLQVKGTNIINGDDHWGRMLCEILEEKTEIPIITYGFEPTNDYVAVDMEYGTMGTRYTLVTPTGEEEIFLNIPGEFMVYNSMAAIINAIEEEIPMSVIKSAMANMPGVEGRMERLDVDADFDVIIDYAHSPDSLEKLLKSVRKIYRGKLVLVFGCNGDRDKAKRPIMGRIAGENADEIVVTSDNPASENPMDIIEAVVRGVAEKTKNFHVVEVRDAGVYFGATLCNPGDVLVLAGKGHEKQEIMKDETLYYNEWDTAREAIARLKK